MHLNLRQLFVVVPLFLNVVPTASSSVENVTSRENTLANNVEGLLDVRTPFGAQLSSRYKRSFAYKIVEERIPDTINRTICLLGHKREEIIRNYGQSSGVGELDRAIERIGELRNEIPNNEPLKPLVYSSNEVNSSDSKIVDAWNDYLVERTAIEGGVPKWYTTIWIYNEPYMYQRISQAFRLTETLRSYDPFFDQKKESFDESIDAVTAVASYTVTQLNRARDVSPADRKIELIKFLKLELWGNRRDLSVSGGAPNNQLGDPVESLINMDEEILVNDTELVWKALTEARATRDTVTVDIVLDNSGYELFTDLCMASFLAVNNLADKIRFYVKVTPWFISDVTRRDFRWAIGRMTGSSNSDLAQLGERANGYLESGVWSIEEESFWTKPYTYSEMAIRDPALYAKLSQADLIMFKGDLNYRKLVGDVNWEYTTTFSHALQGFLPSNIVSLRTVKAEVCVGLKPRQGETIGATNPDWMTTGQYGLIQGVSVHRE